MSLVIMNNNKYCSLVNNVTQMLWNCTLMSTWSANVWLLLWGLICLDRAFWLQHCMSTRHCKHQDIIKTHPKCKFITFFAIHYTNLIGIWKLKTLIDKINKAIWEFDRTDFSEVPSWNSGEKKKKRNWLIALLAEEIHHDLKSWKNGWCLIFWLLERRQR